MTIEEILRILRTENPKAKPEAVRIYADAAFTYLEATANINTVGALTSHPRTGAPLENPYLKVRTAAAATLRKINLKTGDIWK